MLHPLWMVALLVLIVNDHVLKGSVASGWMTGKLSDFAGLIVAPVLFAALLRVTNRRAFVAATAVVFGVFAAINVSPAAAGLWDSAMSLVWPWQTTVDPTDLLALPVAAIGLWLIVPAMERQSERRAQHVARAALATTAAFASIATSQPPPECDELSGNCGFVEEALITSRVSLLNRTHELHVFRISSLRQDISVDCGELQRNPNGVLGRGAFDNTTLWFVQSGQEIALSDGAVTDWGVASDAQGRECHAVLVASETAPDTIVVWNDDFSERTFSFDADIPKDLPIANGTLVLDADYSNTPIEEVKEYRMRTGCGSRADNCAPETLEPLASIPPGARYTWNSRGPNDNTFHHLRPRERFDQTFDPEPYCETPGPGEGLEWTTPPASSFEVVELEEGLDGCHRIGWTLSTDLEPNDWWICAPYATIEPLAPVEGERVDVTVTNLTEGGALFNGVRLDAIRRTDDGEVQLKLDARRIHLVRGFGLPDAAGFDFAIDAREGCEAEIQECGTAALPADIELIGYDTVLRPGESTTIGTVVERQIHLVRASLNPVYDPSCDESMVTVAPPNGETPAYLEVVLTVID